MQNTSAVVFTDSMKHPFHKGTRRECELFINGLHISESKGLAHEWRLCFGDNVIKVFQSLESAIAFKSRIYIFDYNNSEKTYKERLKEAREERRRERERIRQREYKAAGKIKTPAKPTPEKRTERNKKARDKYNNDVLFRMKTLERCRKVKTKKKVTAIVLLLEAVAASKLN